LGLLWVGYDKLQSSQGRDRATSTGAESPSISKLALADKPGYSFPGGPPESI